MSFRPSFLSSFTPAIKNILIINILAFFAQNVLVKFFPFTEMFSLHYPGTEGYASYQLITYMFLHGNFSHLFFNMFAVYMFGIMLESHWGTARFVAFYLVTGVGAGLMQFVVAYFSIQYYSNFLTADQIEAVYREGYIAISQGMNFTEPVLAKLNVALHSTTIGASGAVFGILMAFGMIFPNHRIMLLIPPIPIQAKYFVIIYGVMELFLGVSNFQGDNVAHFAHLGGMLFGFIMILYWRKKGI